MAGRDENPFIAQQVNGNQVAIDPSGYMNGGTLSGTGNCFDADIMYDATGKVAGSCCIRYNGVPGRLKQSTWSTTTFFCQ